MDQPCHMFSVSQDNHQLEGDPNNASMALEKMGGRMDLQPPEDPEIRAAQQDTVEYLKDIPEQSIAWTAHYTILMSIFIFFKPNFGLPTSTHIGIVRGAVRDPYALMVTIVIGEFLSLAVSPRR
ncbi:hypothetical protein FSARC_2486 [Fusarium sarcochroum]|uniref:Uncharacterized protein n=1 Tax=Fusarium sarcochroum TaxID=1208366 RepID=A0A8H4XCW2_9HYPO|nr:hypothetical protein FSARC_2486 [Fusarium sarcochroum]